MAQMTNLYASIIIKLHTIILYVITDKYSSLMWNLHFVYFAANNVYQNDNAHGSL